MLVVSEKIGERREYRMKQINVFPMVIMLIAIILLVIWLRPQ